MGGVNSLKNKGIRHTIQITPPLEKSASLFEQKSQHINL
jgi:hypothetical protein